MAMINLDPEALKWDPNDPRSGKALQGYLYQLTDQLRYWQNHVEEENLTGDFRRSLQNTAGLAAAANSAAAELRRAVSKPARALRNDLVSVTDAGIRVGDGQDGEAARLDAEGLRLRGLTLEEVLTALLRGVICVSREMPGPGCIWVIPGEASGAEGAVECRVLYVPKEVEA